MVTFRQNPSGFSRTLKDGQLPLLATVAAAAAAVAAATMFAVMNSTASGRGALRYDFAASAASLPRSLDGAGSAGAAPGAAKSQPANYVLSTVMGIEPQAVAIFVQSWRRFSPDSRLVVFLEAGTQHPSLEAFGVEIVPFSLPGGTVIHTYRCDLALVFCQPWAMRRRGAHPRARQAGGQLLAQAGPYVT